MARLGPWLRMGLQVLLGLTVVVALALGGMAFWLHRNPQALAERLAEEVRQRSGVACSMDTVDVVFFPMPSLSITDIRMHTDTMDFSVAYITVRPALLPLLRGSFEPGSVTLLRPHLRWQVGCQAPPAQQPSSPAGDLPALAANLREVAIPDALDGTEIRVLHGMVHYADAERQWDVDNVGVDVRLQAPGGLNGSISLGNTLIKRGETLEAALDGLNLRLSGSPLRALDGAPARLVLETKLHMPDALRQVSLRLDVARKKPLMGEKAQWEGEVSLGGYLLWPGTEPGTAPHTAPPPQATGLAAIPFALRGQAQGEQTQSEHTEILNLRHVQVELDKDKLLFDGALDWKGPDGPRLSGDLDIRRLSLTQWFGFARRLPPGLQHSLHQLRGHMRFALDGQGLDVSRVEVQAADGNFSGRGGVPSWKAPVITLDLAAPALTLGKAFPEAEGQTPAPPPLAHAPLTPEPGSPAAKSMAGPDINYDIALRVQEISAWKLKLGEAHFRCLPQERSNAGPHNGQGVLMTFGAGRVQGGRAQGRLLLYDAPSGKTGYAVKADIKNVALEPLLSGLGAGKNLGGRLTLDTEFTAQGQSLAEFFTSQDGVLRLRLDNGFVLKESSPPPSTAKPKPGNGEKAEEPGKWSFTRIQLEARARGGAAAAPPAGRRIPAELTYSGQWKASVDAPELKGSLQLEGPLVLGSQKALLYFQKLPGQVHVELGRDWLQQWGIFSDKAVLSADLAADIKGRFSLHSQERSLAVEETQAALPGLADLKLKGEYRLTWPQKPSGNSEFRAQAEASTANTHQLLSFFVPSWANALPAASLGRAEGQAQVRYQDQSLSVAEMRAKTNKSTVSGQISGTWKGRPQWKFDLAADLIDVDAYLPPRKAAQAPSAPKSAQKNTVSPVPALPPALPWDVAWMKGWDAQGTLNVGILRIRKLSLHKAQLPISLKSGVLNCTGRGDLYGAPAKTSLRAEAAQGLKLRLTLEAQNMNMLALSEERGMSTVLAGQGSLWADIQGLVRSGRDIPAALDGIWRLQINQAWTQSRNAKGILTGGKTTLGNIQAQGLLDKGILRSDHLTVQGPDMTASGAGWVNLTEDTLDVNLLVNMYRFPEFPVRYYGSLDDPQRSINAGKAIVGTLGNLGSGVVDVLGNVLGGALKLLP